MIWHICVLIFHGKGDRLIIAYYISPYTLLEKKGAIWNPFCPVFRTLGENTFPKTATRGGGGGTSIIMYAYWVCAAKETPIFSHEFPVRSISFSQITKNSVHHFKFFGGFCRSGDPHFQNFKI